MKALTSGEVMYMEDGYDLATEKAARKYKSAVGFVAGGKKRAQYRVEFLMEKRGCHYRSRWHGCHEDADTWEHTPMGRAGGGGPSSPP